MALQTTGTISLANIQTEFGGADPISLSEYYAGGTYVPASTGSIPSSGLISINAFYGTTARPPAWILDLSSIIINKYDSRTCCVYNTYNGKITIPANVRNTSYDALSSHGGIVEIDALGNATTTIVESFWAAMGGVAVDTSGNKYLFSSQSSKSNLIKLNSNNVFQWKKELATVYAGDSGPLEVVVDSSYIYTCSINNSNTAQLNLAKYDFSGNVIYAKLLPGANSSNYYEYSNKNQLGIGNTYLYFTTVIRIPSPSSAAVVVGRFTKETGIRVGSNNGQISQGNNHTTGGSIVGSDGYVYNSSIFGSGSSYDLVTTKFAETNGPANAVFTQHIVLSISSYKHICGAHAIDSSNNIYVCCSIESYSSNTVLIAKYNSSGIIQWQRRFSHNKANTFSLSAPKILVDNAGSYIMVIGNLVVKLPVDGSLTGSYSNNLSASYSGYNFIYDASTFTTNTALLGTSTAAFSTTAQTDQTSVAADTSITLRSQSITKLIRDLP